MGNKKVARYAHMRKGRKVRSDATTLHKHPSYPYFHPEGRVHFFPPKSRIRDRKGKAFRHTPQELRRTGVKGTYASRRGKRKRWD